MILLCISAFLYIFFLLVFFIFRAILKKRKNKWFAIPYDRWPIAIALALLAVAAGMLASGDEDMANDFAIMAYYLLVLGVVLQIINYIREQRAERRIKGSGGKDSGSRSLGEDHSAEDE